MKETKLFYDGLMTETSDGMLLRASKCHSCGKIQYPSKHVCPQCAGDECDEISIGKYGKLFSFTTTYAPVSKMKPPVTVGYIQLDEGVRVFAPLKQSESAAYEIGMDMELETAPLWEEEENIILGYTYKMKDSEKEAAK